MGLINLKVLGLKLPLYDLGALAAGFFIGYSEGKGIDRSTFVEYLTKYGPTGIAMAMTPLAIKMNKGLMGWTVTKINQSIKDGSLRVTLPDKSVKEYRDLTEEERHDDRFVRFIDTQNTIEEKLKEPPRYLRRALRNGVWVAGETAVGYFAGRLYSQIS